MKRFVIGRRIYDPHRAQLLASSCELGRTVSLYRTPKGRYFRYCATMWEHETDSLEPLTPAEAEALYQYLPKKELPFEEAFPDVPLEEA